MKTMKEIIGGLRSRLDTLPEIEDDIAEATDVYDKFGIQITRTALKGGLGFQINYGERGRYIQVLKKDMNNLMKAMQVAMKAK